MEFASKSFSTHIHECLTLYQVKEVSDRYSLVLSALFAKRSAICSNVYIFFSAFFVSVAFFNPFKASTYYSLEVLS